MKPFALIVSLVIATAASGVTPTVAYTNLIPQLDFIYPAGGRQGEEVEIVVGGNGLSAITSAHFSGEGVSAVFLGAAQKTRYNAKGVPIATIIPNRYRFNVIIEPNAPVGLRTLRVGSAMRISEPLYFEVTDGKVPERHAETNGVTACTLPICLNGSVRKTPDRYRFELLQGTEIVVFPVCEFPTGKYTPPEMTVTGPDGTPCSTVQTYPTDRGGKVMTFKAEQAGPHTLTIALPQGATDIASPEGNTYRVKVGAFPLVVDFTPKSAKKGTSVNIRLTGVNLPQNRIRLFTGGKDEALCRKAIVGDGLILPNLNFRLTEEDDEPSKPDFRVWMTPASVSIPSVGSSVPIHLFAERLNGFEGEIDVRLDYPPLSIAFEGGHIPAGESEGILTVSTDGARFPKTYFTLEFAATATVDGQPAKRPVRPFRSWHTEETPQDALTFSDVGAVVSPGLQAIRLSSRVKPFVYSKDTRWIAIVKGPIAAAWGTVYEPVILWPRKGVTVRSVSPQASASGTACIRFTIDPAIYPAGSGDTLLVGAIVKKTGILIATTQAFPFIVK